MSDLTDDEQAYADLADELNDDGVKAWDESDWDADVVAAARRYAKAKRLRFPPGLGDYDRFWERRSTTA